MRTNTSRLRQVAIPAPKEESPRKNRQGARVTSNMEVVLIIDIENDFLFLDGKNFWMGKNSFFSLGSSPLTSK